LDYDKKILLKKFYSIFLLFLILSTTNLCIANDWGSCAYDLNRLQRATRDAAEQAESKRQEFENKKEDLENCKTGSSLDGLLLKGQILLTC